MPVKTTIILKDELYEHLVKNYGRRKISKTINDVLTNHFSRPKKSRFGVDRWLTVKGLRDEKEPHETLDSFVWIEYFSGSEKGASVKGYVEGTESLDKSAVARSRTQWRSNSSG